MIVPFLIRVHNVPIDCSRWTEDGLKFHLEECGFKIKIFLLILGEIKSVLYLILEQMILGQGFGFIEISRMKKIFQFKFGLLQKKIKAP